MATRGGKGSERRGDMAEPWVHRFGIEVRAKRSEANITQQELAARVGYENAGMISQIERGDVTPHFDKVLKLAQYLNLDMNRILGLHGSLEGSGDWWSEMLMIRLPSKVHDLWEPSAQQEILVRMVEEMGRAMRETMGARTEAAQAPSSGPVSLRPQVGGEH
jgi:transcriptional regulator with XRE-family HTH domain